VKPAQVDAGWLARLRAGADVPPLRARVPLRAAARGGAVIGSVEPGFLTQIAPPRLADGGPVVEPAASGGEAGWMLHGDVTAGLALVALALRDAGLAHAWRNEQLAVPDEHGVRAGTVERAVMRVLGITTCAVHLVGQAPDGRFWVQQRSFSKANDPGLWDTLMGGMVSAADSLETALERETWEEAGLVLASLQDVAWGGRITTRRPAADGGGAGYVVEHIDWYRCTVPDGMAPVNQDGEVERFGLVSREQLVAGLHQGEFTTEAALILSDSL